MAVPNGREIGDAFVHPPIDELLDAIPSKFTLVKVAAERARQIGNYYNGLGYDSDGDIPPQVASRSYKPLSIAFEEIVAGKIIPAAENAQIPTDASSTGISLG